VSSYEVNEVWIPAMGARTVGDIGFKIMLEQIRADLGPGSSVVGSVSRVLVTVKIDASSEEKAKTVASSTIAEVMRGRPFIIDGTAPRSAVALG
jgi:hypothetical protein